MPAYDNNHLLDLLRSHTRIPAVPGFEDADCLRDLTAQLHSYILPQVKAEGQEHYLSAESATYSTALVEGGAEYELPGRCVAGGIRTALLVSQGGRVRTPLHFIEVDALERLPPANAVPSRYAVRSNRLVLYPTPRNVSGYTLRLPMLVRPARLVLPSECGAAVTVVDGVGGAEVTLATPVSGLSDELFVDVVRAREPFENLLLEAAATWDGPGTTATLTGLSASVLRPGDYLCPVGTSPFAQCPVEMLELLARRTAVEQLAGHGDMDVASAKAASLQEGRKDARTNIKPRSGDPRPQRNGMDKWGGGGGRGWW
jgi:hypothetical protein